MMMCPPPATAAHLPAPCACPSSHIAQHGQRETWLSAPSEHTSTPLPAAEVAHFVAEAEPHIARSGVVDLGSVRIFLGTIAVLTRALMSLPSCLQRRWHTSSRRPSRESRVAAWWTRKPAAVPSATSAPPAACSSIATRMPLSLVRFRQHMSCSFRQREPHLQQIMPFECFAPAVAASWMG